jgi:hypothetical protein
MANFLDELNQEIPDFPTGAPVEHQIEFLYEQIVALNRRIAATAQDAPVGVDSDSFTASSGETVTVTDGVITEIV